MLFRALYVCGSVLTRPIVCPYNFSVSFHYIYVVLLAKVFPVHKYSVVLSMIRTDFLLLIFWDNQKSIVIFLALALNGILVEFRFLNYFSKVLELMSFFDLTVFCVLVLGSKTSSNTLCSSFCFQQSSIIFSKT